MSYVYIDTDGVRGRRSRLVTGAGTLRATRLEAWDLLVGSGAANELGVLAPIAEAAGFADRWADRIEDHLADAELGPGWRALVPVFAILGLGETEVRAMLYRQLARSVAEAMRSGQSPDEAGLPASAFPDDYREAFEQIAALEQRAADLAVEAYMQGSARGYESSIEELLGEAESLRPRVTLADVRRFIYSTPLLPEQEDRHAVFADVLVDDLEAEGFDEPWFSPIRAELETAAAELDRGTAGFAAAFFQRLGPEQAAFLDAHFRRVDDSTAVASFASALARASHSLPTSYAVDLIAAAGSEPMWELQVGNLFAVGDFDYDFLLAAYDEAEAQFDGRDYSWSSYPPAVDSRATILGRLADHGDFDAVAFFTDARIAELFDDAYTDDGFAAMKPLLVLGTLDADSAAVRDRVAAIVSHVGREGGRLQHYPAVGAAALAGSHIPLFGVESWYNPETGEFDAPVFSTFLLGDLGWHDYGPTDPEGQVAFEKDKVMFLEVVMRDPEAQLILFDSLAVAVAELGVEHITDAPSAMRASDELGSLVGRFADVAGGLAQQQGKSQDTANKWKKWIVGTTLSVAGSLLAAHYITGFAAATLVKQVVGVGRSTGTKLVLDRIFPTNNEKQALEDRFHDAVSIEPSREHALFLTRVLFEAAPELYDLGRIPPEIVADGRWVDPLGSTHGFCIDPGLWNERWEEWWNSGPFRDEELNTLVASAGSIYSHNRTIGAAEGVNGPDLPFTDD